MLPGKRQAEVNRLRKIVSNSDFKTPADVEQFFIAYTNLIWDYKMVGIVYDHYDENTIVHLENGRDVVGVDAVIKDTIIRCNAIPDLKINFLDIFAEGDEENGYKFVQVAYNEGTNTGPSEFGPATGNKINYDNFMNICECLVKKVNGQWKVTEEWGSQSNKESGG